jgi:hypothetical protein
MDNLSQIGIDTCSLSVKNYTTACFDVIDILVAVFGQFFVNEPVNYLPLFQISLANLSILFKKLRFKTNHISNFIRLMMIHFAMHVHLLNTLNITFF